MRNNRAAPHRVPYEAPHGAATVRRILGIDTSLRATGIGVLDFSGTPPRVLCGETIRNAASVPLSQCLCTIETRIQSCIREFSPEAIAIESVFFARYIRAVLLLGHARGVAIVACAREGIPIFEYEPRRVKQAVVGFGGAAKIQVQRMVQSILFLKEPPAEDVADALALALCHHHTRRTPIGHCTVPL